MIAFCGWDLEATLLLEEDAEIIDVVERSGSTVEYDFVTGVEPLSAISDSDSDISAVPDHWEYQSRPYDKSSRFVLNRANACFETNLHCIPIIMVIMEIL